MRSGPEYVYYIYKLTAPAINPMVRKGNIMPPMKPQLSDTPSRNMRAKPVHISSFWLRSGLSTAPYFTIHANTNFPFPTVPGN